MEQLYYYISLLLWEKIHLFGNGKGLFDYLFESATFVSALVAIGTLIQVKKQREATYKPELILKPLVITIHESPLFTPIDEVHKFSFSDFNDHSINSNELTEHFSIKYRFHNLGLGIAKNIKAYWKFDFESAIEIIEDLMTGSDYSFSRHNKTVYLQHKSDNIHYSCNINDTPHYTDVIPPASVYENTYYDSVPNEIIYTHILYSTFKYNLTSRRIADPNMYEEFKAFPKPSIYIEYSDLNNKKLLKELDLKMTIISTPQFENKEMSEYLDLTKPCMMLYLEIEKQ